MPINQNLFEEELDEFFNNLINSYLNYLSQEDEIELTQRMGEVMVEFLNERNLQPECFKVINIEPVAPSAPWEGEDDV